MIHHGCFAALITDEEGGRGRDAGEREKAGDRRETDLGRSREAREPSLQVLGTANG